MVLFRDAVAMVELSPALSHRVAIIGGQNTWNMALLSTARSFAPSAATTDKAGRAHTALIDEIHEHKADIVIEMMRAGFKGGGSRSCS